MLALSVCVQGGMSMRVYVHMYVRSMSRPEVESTVLVSCFLEHVLTCSRAHRCVYT